MVFVFAFVSVQLAHSLPMWVLLALAVHSSLLVAAIGLRACCCRLCPCRPAPLDRLMRLLVVRLSLLGLPLEVLELDLALGLAVARMGVQMW